MNDRYITMGNSPEALIREDEGCYFRLTRTELVELVRLANIGHRYTGTSLRPRPLRALVPLDDAVTPAELDAIRLRIADGYSGDYPSDIKIATADVRALLAENDALRQAKYDAVTTMDAEIERQSDLVITRNKELNDVRVERDALQTRIDKALAMVNECDCPDCHRQARYLRGGP